jgi:predicted nucleic acid-binding protein
LILVDTSVWIDFLRGINSPERRLLHRLIENNESISITELILTEILQGVKKDEDFQILQKYLLKFVLYKPKGTETYLRAASLYRSCRENGKTIRKTLDCVIAAICLENDAAILHKDSDFDRIATCTKLKILKA